MKKVGMIAMAASMIFAANAFARDVNADAAAQAAGKDAVEENAYMDFSSAEIGGWAKDGNKKYVYQNDHYAKLQSNSGSECTKYASLVDTGDGDKALSLDLPNSATTLLVNYSDQASSMKNLENAVIKVRVYIPEDMVKDGLDKYATIKFILRDFNWGIPALKGSIDGLTVKDIGAGWQTLTLDCANLTYEFGNAKDKFTFGNKGVLKKSSSFDIVFNIPKAGDSKETILIDYISIEGLK